MSWLRVKTVVRRHWYVLWRSPNRWFDIAVWPVFDVFLVGIDDWRQRFAEAAS